jgi:preprotein translocase subunit SecA
VAKELDLKVTAEELTGISQDQARQKLWNAFDERYRPEMHSMERGLLLAQLDTSWKSHLLQMDQLREAMNLVWVGQIDAKTEYKVKGRKEFATMWEGIQDKVTDMVFRMEEMEAFQDSVWTVGAAIHESAPRLTAGQEEGIANKSEKKAEPIRNRGDKVGRNDPCPCGSGKKYKNCHMRSAAV